MAWIITLHGRSCSSDEFTLADLEAAEKAAGQPWSLLNPLASIPVARAFAGIALRMQAVDDVDAALEAMTAGDLKRAFRFVEDEPIPGDGQEDGEFPLDRAPGTSTRSSSPGAPEGTPGGRRKHAGNA